MVWKGMSGGQKVQYIEYIILSESAEDWEQRRQWVCLSKNILYLIYLISINPGVFLLIA